MAHERILSRLLLTLLLLIAVAGLTVTGQGEQIITNCQDPDVNVSMTQSGAIDAQTLASIMHHPQISLVPAGFAESVHTDDDR